MIKQPLFGQDSSPHITSMLISAIATLICWIIFCVLCFVVKFKPAVPEYKEIQIVLSSTPVEEKTATTEQAAAEEQSSVVEPTEAQAAEVPEIPNPVETPVAQAKVEAPKETPAPAKTQKATTETQTTPAKKETPADKKVSDQIYKSVEELMEEQMSTKKTSSVPDWWDNDTSVNEQQTEVTQTPGKVTTQSGMTGSAGRTGGENTSQKSSSQQDNYTLDKTPGKEVTDARERILNAGGSNNSNEIPSENQNTSSSKTQNFEFSWEGSGKRTELSTLSINLDGITIESTRTVTITIKVLESGYVDPGSIDIDISSLLSKEIRERIYNSISKWRFNSSNGVSSATFKFTIQKQ